MERTERGGGKGKMGRSLSLSPRPKLRFGDKKRKMGQDMERLSGLETNTHPVLFNHLRCQLGVSR